MKRRHIKLFVHIPKTAGSSFSKVIHENEKNVINFKGLKSFIYSKIDDNAFITGHMQYGVAALGLFDAQYITFLRNPTERCISWYYFAQEWHKHPTYHDAKNNNIVDFYRIKKYQNMQSKFIGGHILLPNEYIPIQYILSIAKKRLEKNFDFGITEKYEQSVKLLCSRLNWSNQPIIHIRQAKLRPKTEDIPENTLQAIMELNKADWELYNYANRIFQMRCQHIGID